MTYPTEPRYTYDENTDTLTITIIEPSRKARVTQAQEILPGVYLIQPVAAGPVEGIQIHHWEQEWGIKRLMIAEALTGFLLPSELGKAVINFDPDMVVSQNEQFLWKVVYRSGGAVHGTTYVIAPYAKAAVLKNMVHFYERDKKVESTKGEGEFLNYTRMVDGGVVSFSPRSAIQVCLHTEHTRRGLCHLENLHEFTTEELTGIMEEAHKEQDRSRVQRYLGTIWRYDQETKETRGMKAMSGCLATSRGGAARLLAQNYLGQNWGDTDWRITVTEYSAMGDDSGLLLEANLRAELGMG